MAGGEAVMFFFLVGWLGWCFGVGLDAYMNVMIPVSYSGDRWGWSLGDVVIPLLCIFECDPTSLDFLLL